MFRGYSQAIVRESLAILDLRHLLVAAYLGCLFRYPVGPGSRAQALAASRRAYRPLGVLRGQALGCGF